MIFGVFLSLIISLVLFQRFQTGVVTQEEVDKVRALCIRTGWICVFIGLILSTRKETNFYNSWSFFLFTNGLAIALFGHTLSMQNTRAHSVFWTLVLIIYSIFQLYYIDLLSSSFGITKSQFVRRYTQL